MKSDLDQIAINDMRHELCDVNPCMDCADFKYQVLNGELVLGTYYGSNLLETQAFNFAMDLAKNLKNSDIHVNVFDQRDHSTETSCYYEFHADGTYQKIG